MSDSALIKDNEITASVFDYFELLKPRVMVLVVFTSFCGYWLSPGIIHPFLASVGILAIAMGAGASGCLNQWYERDSDKKMSRTKNRPVARGGVSPDSALSFGLILSISSVLLLQVTFGTFQSIFLAITIFFYAFFYTVVLKPNTPQNIVLGGAAGAFPPLIGYSFSGVIDLYALTLFLIIFFWTPTHFWALSLKLKDDYKNANIPIMPNIKGDIYTKNLMCFYAILTSCASLFILCLRNTPFTLWIGIIILNVGWLFFAYQSRISMQNKQQMNLFFYSIVYLFLTFLLLLILH